MMPLFYLVFEHFCDLGNCLVAHLPGSFTASERSCLWLKLASMWLRTRRQALLEKLCNNPFER